MFALFGALEEGEKEEFPREMAGNVHMWRYQGVLSRIPCSVGQHVPRCFLLAAGRWGLPMGVKSVKQSVSGIFPIKVNGMNLGNG